MSDLDLKQRWFANLCLTISTAFLVAGYLSAGWWQILLVFPAVLLLWMLSKYLPGICVPSVLFSSYLLLASLGIWMGLAPYLLVYGSILALAAWELQLFQRGLAGSFQHSNIGYLEKHHLKSLSAVILLGFLITTVGLNFQLKLPFGVAVMLVLFVGFVIERVYFYFNQKSL